MATEKQIAANRRNAAKSTGPKSALGKRIASRNSTRHGFYSTSVVLSSEDRGEFVRFSRRLVEHYAPIGILEEEQVKTIAETRWQLRRANTVDAELFQIYRFYENENRGVGTAFAQDATQGNAFSKLSRYQAQLLRRLQTAEKELARLQSSRQAGPRDAAKAPHQPLQPDNSTPSPETMVMPNPSEVEPAIRRVRNWLMQRD